MFRKRSDTQPTSKTRLRTIIEAYIKDTSGRILYVRKRRTGENAVCYPVLPDKRISRAPVSDGPAQDALVETVPPHLLGIKGQARWA